MSTQPAFLIKISEIHNDYALHDGGRGARKIAVTDIFPDVEYESNETTWHPNEGLVPVLLMPDSEIAYFNHQAKQDRHYHQRATEIYQVLEGEMTIEVENEYFYLNERDLLVIQPGAAHLVQKSDQPFLSQVISLNCDGKSDKFIVAKK